MALPRAQELDSIGKRDYCSTMPSLKIEKNSQLSATDSYKRITSLLETDKDLRKLDAKYKCQFDEASLSGSADGQHFKAKMKITAAGAGSHVEVSVDLPFHLALVKGMVEKTLSKKLDEVLA
jgi:hypothetical protein